MVLNTIRPPISESALGTSGIPKIGKYIQRTSPTTSTIDNHVSPELLTRLEGPWYTIRIFIGFERIESESFEV